MKLSKAIEVARAACPGVVGFFNAVSLGGCWRVRLAVAGERERTYWVINGEVAGYTPERAARRLDYVPFGAEAAL